METWRKMTYNMTQQHTEEVYLFVHYFIVKHLQVKSCSFNLDLRPVLKPSAAPQVQHESSYLFHQQFVSKCSCDPLYNRPFISHMVSLWTYQSALFTRPIWTAWEKWGWTLKSRLWTPWWDLVCNRRGKSVSRETQGPHSWGRLIITTLWGELESELNIGGSSFPVWQIEVHQDGCGSAVGVGVVRFNKFHVKRPRQRCAETSPAPT